MSWERDLMSWERDLISWERDNYVVGTRSYVVGTRYFFFSHVPSVLPYPFEFSGLFYNALLYCVQGM